jgi:hypothetical protein
LTEKIQIAFGVTLNIEPGVHIIGNGHLIEVFGNLLAVGAAGSEINFQNVKLSPRGTYGEFSNIILDKTIFDGGSIAHPTGL